MRLTERCTSVDVTKILIVCQQMGYQASLNALLFFCKINKKRNEMKVCLEWKLNREEVKKKRNITG